MLVPRSNVHAVFARLTAAAVRRMVGTVQENHLVDFKLIQADLASRDDKRNLAVALSGFANADGGIVIWGVDARRDPNDASIDQVVSTPGVAHPKRLLARLNDLTAQACLPVPVGVDHVVLTSRTGPSFVATLVPPSDSGPHMAKLGEDRYYTRSGGSFLRLEHFQISDMFGRRPAPLLEVSAVKVEPFTFRLRLTNVGRGPARAPFLLYVPPPPFHRNQYGVDGNYNEYLPCIKNHSMEGVLHAGDAGFVVHPTMFVDVGGLWLGHGPSPEILKRAIGASEVRFRVGALGAAPQNGTLTIKPG